jgi:hypothetical protein
MKKVIALLLIAVTLGGLFTGCCNTQSGSREFKPGQGWVPND